jgi:hypothetical protein
MYTYERYTNLEKKILQILLPSMVEAENFSDHPRIYRLTRRNISEDLKTFSNHCYMDLKCRIHVSL